MIPRSCSVKETAFALSGTLSASPSPSAPRADSRATADRRGRGMISEAGALSAASVSEALSVAPAPTRIPETLSACVRSTDVSAASAETSGAVGTGAPKLASVREMGIATATRAAAKRATIPGMCRCPFGTASRTCLSHRSAEERSPLPGSHSCSIRIIPVLLCWPMD